VKALRPGFGLIIAISVVTLAGIMLGRAVAGSRIELATARAYHDEQQLLRAVEHYRRALRWSFPLSPFHDSAVSGLTSIAAELEAAEDRDGALLAWRSLAGGIAATRFIYSRRDADAVRAKDQIDRLLALQGGAAMDANMGTDELHTNLAGGPSGDRLSPWYKSDIPRWLAGEYKVVRPAPPPREQSLEAGAPNARGDGDDAARGRAAALDAGTGAGLRRPAGPRQGWRLLV